MRRRTYLGLATVGTLAGCLGRGDDASDDDDSDDAGAEPPVDDTGNGADAAGDAPQGDDPDDTGSPDVFTPRWSESLEAPSIGGMNYGADIAQETLFVGSEAGLIAFDITDGTRLWHRADMTAFTRVHADSRGVVALTRDMDLVALAAGTGDIRWEQAVEGIPENVIPPSAITFASALVSTDDGVWLFDRETGDTIDQVGGIEPDVVTHENVAILASGFEATRIDPTTGEEEWTADVETTRGGTIAGGTFVVTRPDTLGDEHKVSAVDINSGVVRWQEIVDPIDTVFPGVAVDQGMITFLNTDPDGASVRAYDLANGQSRWEQPIGEPLNVFEPPAMDDGLTIVEGDDELYAFDTETGDRLGTTPAMFLVFEGFLTDGIFLECGSTIRAYDVSQHV